MWAKLKRFFANRWVLAFIGLLVVSLLIWFVGDAIAFYDHRPLGSAGARIGLIILILLIFGIIEGVKQYRAWRANKAMLSAMGEGASSNSAMSQREVAELKKRFDDAMATRTPSPRWAARAWIACAIAASPVGYRRSRSLTSKKIRPWVTLSLSMRGANAYPTSPSAACAVVTSAGVAQVLRSVGQAAPACAPVIPLRTPARRASSRAMGIEAAEVLP